MLTPTRIYVSVPNDHWLPPEQLDIKRGLMDRIKSAGFDPHEFLTTGDLSDLSWSYENVKSILERCQGAVILGLVRWTVRDVEKTYRFNSDFNHFEGALALAKGLPTFILMHERVYKAGIAIKGRTPHFARLPDRVDSAWLQTETFLSKFNAWAKAVKQRRHVFLGYSSYAQATGAKIKGFLATSGVSVMDRLVDFNPAKPVINELEMAANTCLGGIFLFTKEDALATSDTKPGPSMDTLMFETGYFLRAKGFDKVLLILEEGASIPVDISGVECLSFQNQDYISPIEKDLQEFILKNL